eukprot:2797793-Pyramimonas_sp.AAC.1
MPRGYRSSGRVANLEAAGGLSFKSAWQQHGVFALCCPKCARPAFRRAEPDRGEVPAPALSKCQAQDAQEL